MSTIKKLQEIYARSSPIMEVLTGFMIAILIFYSGNLIIKDELGINNFFSFLAAMMLAYQPVRSLATLNITINQGLTGAKRILPVIDHKEKIIDNPQNDQIKIDKGSIEFQNVNFDVFVFNSCMLYKSQSPREEESYRMQYYA